MNKKAMITISSIQMHDKDNKIEVVSIGEFIKTNEGYEVIYEESEISGMEGTTTKVKIHNDTVTLIREGTTCTTMEFKKNNNSVSLYNTPYGMLELKTATKDVRINVNDDGGEIYIDYSLIANGQPPLETNLNLSIKVNN